MHHGSAASVVLGLSAACSAAPDPTTGADSGGWLGFGAPGSDEGLELEALIDTSCALELWRPRGARGGGQGASLWIRGAVPELPFELRLSGAVLLDDLSRSWIAVVPGGARSDQSEPATWGLVDAPALEPRADEPGADRTDAVLWLRLGVGPAGARLHARWPASASLTVAFTVPCDVSWRR